MIFLRLCKLTNATNGQKPCSIIRWIALHEERFHDVLTESECHDCLRARSDYHAFYPESDERDERSESFHDVGVVGSTLSYHRSELCIAIGAYLKQKSIINML